MGRFDKQGMRALLAAVPWEYPAATVHSLEPAMGEEAAPEALLSTGLTTDSAITKASQNCQTRTIL